MAVVPSRPLPPGIPADYNEARRLFETVTAGLKCRDVIHTTTSTCTGAGVDMLGACLLGSVKYFLPYYLIHIIWNARKAISGDKEFYTDLVHCYARSVMFGGAMGTTFSIVSCTLS
ncbi:uncharacterized protein LOC127752155 [Frankliniella occidentalis]|uniref:Uncharacterized protein LOC127752155 n=1 Tax=Frankliniella occidentalis TaxID=133901 RepID=A0A9C6XVE2_FRAOC|nr:uncharacterized protein LOC127752155 [Frankliniella occidentalis]